MTMQAAKPGTKPAPANRAQTENSAALPNSGPGAAANICGSSKSSKGVSAGGSALASILCRPGGFWHPLVWHACTCLPHWSLQSLRLVTGCHRVPENFVMCALQGSSHSSHRQQERPSPSPHKQHSSRQVSSNSTRRHLMTLSCQPGASLLLLLQQAHPHHQGLPTQHAVSSCELTQVMTAVALITWQ